MSIEDHRCMHHTTGMSGNDFWEQEREWLSPFPNFGNMNEKLHPQLGTGMKIPFPFFGIGNETRRCYSREWPGTGTGMALQNLVKIFRKITYIILHYHKYDEFRNIFVQIFYKHMWAPSSSAAALSSLSAWRTLSDWVSSLFGFEDTNSSVSKRRHASWIYASSESNFVRAWQIYQNPGS